MRWMWIDRVISLEPRVRLVAIKNVSLGEDHLHDHFEAESPRRAEGAAGAAPIEDLPALPVMPGSLILEGMAQAAGILVGHAEGFREKVVLAKISRASLEREAVPGDQLRYTAEVQRLTGQGASVAGRIEVRGAGSAEFEGLGSVAMMFSHLDRNMAGQAYPEHNFVFGPTFRMLLETSGISVEK